MQRVKKVIINAIITGAITALSIMASMPTENITTASVYAAGIAGIISGLKEYKDITQEENNKGKRIKDAKPNPLAMFTIF